MIPNISLRAAIRVWQRNATIYKRTYKYNILPNFFEPFFYLLAMGVGLGSYVVIKGADSYVAFIAPGLMASAAMMGATFETTYNVYVKMVYDRIYEAILTTPINVEDLTIGELLWAITRAFIYGFAFFIITIFFNLIHSPLIPLLIIPVILCTGFLFASIGLLFTAYARAIDMYNFYWTLFITPLFLFSGIFFPLDSYPAWAQKVAWFTPLYHCVNISREAYAGYPGEVFFTGMLWCLVIGTLCLFLTLRQMRRRNIN